VVDAFELIRKKLGDPEVLVYNAAIRSLTPEQVLDIPTKRFESYWKTNCFGAFLCAKQVLPAMLERKKGTILFTGATASWRAVGGLAAFAVGKFGLRALGQALAREYGPKGIHVCHIVVDAVVDMPFTRPFMEKKISRWYCSKRYNVRT